jgi:hypothetical protein
VTKPLTKPTFAELSEGVLMLTKLGETDEGVLIGPRGWEIVQDLKRRLNLPTRKGGGNGDTA